LTLAVRRSKVRGSVVPVEAEPSINIKRTKVLELMRAACTATPLGGASAPVEVGRGGIYNPVAMWGLLFAILQTTAADLAEGRELYRLRCAECHGGEGEGGRGPNLAAGVFYHGDTDSDLSRTIQNGITGTEMPGFAGSELRTSQLVAFIRSLNRAARTSELPGDPVRGEGLFRASDCLSCHRLGPEGSFAGPDLNSVGSRRSLRHLRDSLVDPSRDVRPHYRVASVVEVSGARARGFLLDEDRHTIQVLDLDGVLRSFSRQELASVETSRESIMPSYADVFDEGGLNDLISFLSTRRGGARR
jgi:putative heme-binding domain-containing protein